MTATMTAPAPSTVAAVPMLEVEGVVAGFGPTTVLHGVAFSAPAGQVAGVFGLNGAGKSVTMKVLAGIVPAREGSIRFRGEDITSVPAEARVARGMAHVPQGRQVFAALSVEENLRLGAYTLRRRERNRYESVLSSVYDRFPVLAERRTQIAGTMSGGQQAALAVARALMAEPVLVLVDEPSAGLSPLATKELLHTLRGVADTGVTMVLVEQNVTFGLQVVHSVNVLQTGRVVLSTPIADLDSAELTKALGIGRLLQSGVDRAVAARADVPETSTQPARVRRPRSRPAAATKAVAGAPAKKSATKKASPVKKSATKKATATQKKAAAATKVAKATKKKATATKKRGTA